MATQPTANADRRREPRQQTEGAVRLSFDDPVRLEIDGRFIDRSRGGFRASHSCTLLRTGQEVAFRSNAGSGRARVMWNRVTPGLVETGFLILD